MKFNEHLRGEEFGLNIAQAARNNYYIICAVKRLIYAAQYPDDAQCLLKLARAYVDKELERISCAEAAADDLCGLAKYEAQ